MQQTKLRKDKQREARIAKLSQTLIKAHAGVWIDTEPDQHASNNDKRHCKTCRKERDSSHRAARATPPPGDRAPLYLLSSRCKRGCPERWSRPSHRCDRNGSSCPAP